MVTGATAALETESARLGVAAIFASVICHEDVVQKKPHPEGIDTSLERLRSFRDDCCFVGDTPDDIRMGRSAGVRTIGVRSEFVDKGRMEQCGADLLLENISEIPDRILEPCSL